MVKAGIDCIEIGFFQDEGAGDGKTVYLNSEDAKRFIPKEKNGCLFTVLADCSRYSVSNLDKCDGTSTFEAKDIFELGLGEDNGRRFDKIFANYPFGMRIKELGLGNQYLEQLEKRIPSVSKVT